MDTGIKEILKRNQLSVTASREKILHLFLEGTGALAHGDIEKKAGEKFDRVTVYRTLTDICGERNHSYHSYCR